MKLCRDYIYTYILVYIGGQKVAIDNTLTARPSDNGEEKSWSKRSRRRGQKQIHGLVGEDDGRETMSKK